MYYRKYVSVAPNGRYVRDLHLVPNGLIGLFCEVTELFDCGPIQIITVFFTIVCGLRKLVSTLQKTCDILLHIVQLERSIDHFDLASLALDGEAEKQE